MSAKIAMRSTQTLPKTLFALALLALPAQAAVLSDADVLARTGRSTAQWGNAWWQWAFDQTLRQGNNVFDDPSGALGALGNVGGPVFFAEGSSGNPVNASYQVPGDQLVLLPVATYLWTIFDFQDGSCADASCAAQIINDNFIGGLSNLSATLDGVPFMDWASHLVRADAAHPALFDVYVGDCAAGQDPSSDYCGLQPAMQGGYFLMLDALPVGPHTFSFSFTANNLDPATGEVIPGTTDFQTTLNLTSVPEPGTELLMALGLMLLVLPRMRRGPARA